MRKWFAIFRSAYSSWAAVLGTILATIALCNFAFRVMDVSTFEALTWVLDAYRKTFHPPIDYLLSLFSLRLPTVTKDLSVLYVAIGGVLFRTLSYEEPSPEEPSPLTAQLFNRWGTRLRMWSGTIIAAVCWPVFLRNVLRHPSFLIRSSLGYHGRMPPPRRDLSPAKRKIVMQEMLFYIGKDAIVICNERQLLGVYAVALLAAVAGLVILNAAVDHLSAAG